MAEIIPFTIEELSEVITSIEEFNTIQEAMAVGFDSAGKGVVYSINGGPAASYSSSTLSAINAARTGTVINAEQQTVKSAAVQLFKTSGGKYKPVPILATDVGYLGAVCAPVAGVALGAEMYRENPEFWTGLSQKILPFCYPGTYYAPSWLDIIKSGNEYVYNFLVNTGIVEGVSEYIYANVPHLNPPVLNDLPNGIYSTGNCSIKELINTLTFISEEAREESLANMPDVDDWACVILPERCGPSPTTGYLPIGGCGTLSITEYETRISGYVFTGRVGPNGLISVGTGSRPNQGTSWAPSEIMTGSVGDSGWNPSDVEYPNNVTKYSAEPIPIEPYPDSPVIDPTSPEPETTPVIPFPIPNPNYPVEPIPLTPSTPMPLPINPDVEPEEWPEKEPFPKVIPFPYTDPDPSQNPDDPIPNVIPFPLPSNPPEEWPTTPEIPEEWPEPYPDVIPWPKSPGEWPDDVPWPDAPPENWPPDEPWPESPEQWPLDPPWPETPYPDFPESVPWPDNPYEWPDDVPWPDEKPDGWPDGWPEEEPWPESPEEWPQKIKWPDPRPDDWPEEEPWPPNWPKRIPYPDPVPDSPATPDPDSEPDPDVLEPYIEPTPNPNQDTNPEPEPNPDPYIDPTIPNLDPIPFIEPNPNPDTPYEEPNPDDPPPLPPPVGISPTPLMPTTPDPYSSAHGLITVYHPSQQILFDFCDWLWVTYADTTIDKIWNNPFDGIIALFELYCTPSDLGTKTIRSGFLDSQISCPYISRYKEINCGTLGIPEYYGNYFDYSPYSRAHIYLPFIGIQELNVDDIVGHFVNVTYRIDCYNGSCIAMITCAKVTRVNGSNVEYSNTMYQFSGNCAVELPLSGGSQSTIVAGMTTADAYQTAGEISATFALVGGLGSLMSANPIGGAASAVGSSLTQTAYAHANYLQNMLGGKSNVQKSGTFGSSHGALGIKTPYITVIRPKQIQVPNYNALYGYPAHKMVTIGSCSGYLRCREANVVSATATDAEKSLIETMLKSGIYVTE